jgi:hypothetical protein
MTKPQALRALADLLREPASSRSHCQDSECEATRVAAADVIDALLAREAPAPSWGLRQCYILARRRLAGLTRKDQADAHVQQQIRDWGFVKKWCEGEGCEPDGVLRADDKAMEVILAAPAPNGLRAQVEALRDAPDDAFDWCDYDMEIEAAKEAFRRVLALLAQAPEASGQLDIVSRAMDALETGSTHDARQAAWNALRDEFFPVQPSGKEPR